VADIDKILQGLQNTMAVMEELQRRQAARSQEHQNWLEDLTRGWTSHQASIRA
jgi:preprotein translocase subunit YajC